jgi:ribosome recycling factor
MLEDLKKDAAERMAKCVVALKGEFKRMRTGRASTSLLEHLKVDYYGAEMPLAQVANVIVEDSRTLAVTPWDKSIVPVIEKAIMKSDLGLTPNTAGSVIRLPMPALTEERRKELIKVVHREAESARVAVRNIRRDAITHLKDLLKAKSVAEDEERRAQEDVQKLTDRYVGEIDKVLHAKEADLLAV